MGMLGLSVSMSGMGGVGNRVRWPAKRMSVVEMNKRVRALVEWVGREQAAAAERRRRADELRAALKGVSPGRTEGTTDSPVSEDMAVEVVPPVDGVTGKLMEELMEELIGFQEKFGRSTRS
jgi:hypothetical protein